MAGTQFLLLSSVNSSVHTNYFDSLINQNTNFMALDIRKPGIYSGGYLTGTDSSHFSLSPLTCEIQDSGGTGNQVRLVTNTTITGIGPVSATNLVVLRWTYTASSTLNYPSIYIVSAGSQNSTDLIIGSTVAGSPVTADYGVTYTAYPRSDPSNILDLDLKVEPVGTYNYAASNGVILRGGRINYGSYTSTIPTQVVTGFPLPTGVGNSQICPIQITQTGTPASPTWSVNVVTTGTPTVSPVPPAYSNVMTVAEVTVYNSGGTAYITAIKDVRCFTSSGVPVNSLLPAQASFSGYYLTTNGTTPSWGLVSLNSLLPSQVGNNGYFLTTNGTNTSWAAVTQVPATQAGYAGYSLVTDGVNIFWGDPTYAA